MSRGWTARTAAIASLPFLLVSVWAWWSPAWSATRVGDAEVITPIDAPSSAGQRLGTGTTLTAFSLRLPTGASCRGDSANDGYRVQSYMVPARIDPASLTFGSVGPVPPGTGAAFRQPLFTTTSDPFVNHQTAAATKRPGPGPIVNIPAVDFAVFKAGDIPVGTYNVGIACTKGPASATQLDTFWNTTLVLAAAKGPGAAVGWTAPSAGQVPPAAPPASPASPTPPAGPATVATATPDAAPAATVTTVLEETAPTGAPPSLGFPVSGLISHVRIVGGSRLALAMSAALVLVVMRVALLLVRPVPAVVVAR